MANPQTPGRRKEFRERGIPEDTMISTDTYDLILRQDSLNRISNSISRIIGRKMLEGEINQLVNFIAHARESTYYNLSYAQAIQKIANSFIARFKTARATALEEDNDSLISGVSRDTDQPTISDYERKEIAQFSPDEQQYKFTAFADRRGNAVIDEKKDAGLRSTPDNILPVGSGPPGELDKQVYRMAKLVSDFMAPESTEQMFNRIETSNLSYNSVNLRHQTVQFDTRNRLPQTSQATNNYKWYIHTAGQVGQLGDIRTQDTLQQIVKMTLSPFWAPLNSSVVNPYRQIRMLVLEYISQAITVAEFNDPTLSEPTAEHYHFQLDVQEVRGDRMLLTPREAFYFRYPVANILNTFTVHFRTPFLNEVFDIDSGTFTITYGNPTLFTITNPSTFTLSTGDLVYIYNSNSGDSVIDDAINQLSGWFIAKLSNTQFTIALDSSAVAGDEENIYVYYGSKRIFFQIEFTSLEQ
jgi:hypothetical protein